MTIQRVRGAAARDQVVALLREREPEATWALAILLRPASERDSKVWLVRRPDGGVAGVLVSSRYCLDRWSGVVLLDDPSCAAEMAAVLDRSNVWSVVGPASVLETVLPLAKRGRSLNTTWFHAVPPEATASARVDEATTGGWGQAGLVVRRATRDDLGALVALYGRENAFRVPLWRLRGAVSRAIDRTFVAEAADGVEGAVLTAPGLRYSALNSLVVASSMRGTRVAAALALHVALGAIADGKGFCGFRQNREPSLLLARALLTSRQQLEDIGEVTRWGSAVLWPPRRFKGHTRLRAVVERVESRMSERLAARIR